jgi:hypothetical protein
MDARMRRVETAKEWVDPNGRIHGIDSVTNVSSGLAMAAAPSACGPWRWSVRLGAS